MKLRRSTWWFLPGVIFLDQITKWWASRFNLVNLNQGIAFGWGSGFSLYLIVGIVLIVGWLLFDSWQKRQLRFQLGLTLILSGGISNLIDRLIWGGVRDFIPMWWWHNNLADIAIVSGLILFLWQILKLNLTSQKNHV